MVFIQPKSGPKRSNSWSHPPPADRRVRPRALPDRSGVGIRGAAASSCPPVPAARYASSARAPAYEPRATAGAAPPVRHGEASGGPRRGGPVAAADRRQLEKLDSFAKRAGYTGGGVRRLVVGELLKWRRRPWRNAHSTARTVPARWSWCSDGGGPARAICAVSPVAGVMGWVSGVRSPGRSAGCLIPRLCLCACVARSTAGSCLRASA